MLPLCKAFPLLASAVLLACNNVLAAPAPSGPTVSIASGVVVGKTTTVTSGASTTSTAINYLGVPFAAAPTGSLRFKPPVTPSAWSQPVVATALPPACLQQFTGGDAEQDAFNNPGHTRPAEDEDCLYLNIFAPTSASPSNKKPVMFWIFGGNLDFGTASLSYYNGSSFAAFQDIVVVAINYRTNIFGFPAATEIPSGQRNVGYLDQRLALQWVQENIAPFGGDPSRVTIFGESAGAYSVKQLLANPPSPLPFASAILESQAITSGSNKGFPKVAAHFNCSNASSPLTCLQSIPASAIETYITKQSISFYPDVDGITEVSDVRPSILSKTFAPVPVMIGTNANEASIFLALMNLDTTNLDISQVKQILESLLPNHTFLIDTILAAYSALTSVPFELLSAVVTDLIFLCPTSLLGSYLASNGYGSENGAGVWRYWYNATFPNLQLYPGLGAFHTSEIPQVWGTYDLDNIRGEATPDQLALSAYMQKTWAEFAKNPKAGPAWPELTGNALTDQMGELGGMNPTGETTIALGEVDFQCPLFDVVIDIGGL